MLFCCWCYFVLLLLISPIVAGKQSKTQLFCRYSALHNSILKEHKFKSYKFLEQLNITFCMKKIFWKNYHFKSRFSPLYIHLLNDENISVVGLTKILMAEMSRANNSWTCQHKTDVSHQIDISHCHQLTSSYLSLVGNYRPILMFSPRIITAEVIHIEVGRED